jgi:cell shape-determining protein MreC
VASLLLGLVLSYLVYLIRAISTSFTLRGKDNEIKKEKVQILGMTKRIRQLEEENEKLKKNFSPQPDDKTSV